MIDKVQEFLCKCPYLSGKAVNVNYLGHDVGSCSLECTADSSLLKGYADGGQLRCEEFVLAVREAYSADKTHGLAASALLENVRKWLLEQNADGVLPELEGERAVSLKAEHGYELKTAGSVDARYEMRLRLVYYTE